MYFLLMHTIDLASALTKGTEHTHGIGGQGINLILFPVIVILAIYFWKAYQAK
jgi:hypothetical protein